MNEKFLHECLPLEHRNLVRLFGLWKYSVYAPISLDDAPEIVVSVHYGQTKSRAFRKYVFGLKQAKARLA